MVNNSIEPYYLISHVFSNHLTSPEDLKRLVHPKKKKKKKITNTHVYTFA